MKRYVVLEESGLCTNSQRNEASGSRVDLLTRNAYLICDMPKGLSKRFVTVHGSATVVRGSDPSEVGLKTMKSGKSAGWEVRVVNRPDYERALKKAGDYLIERHPAKR